VQVREKAWSMPASTVQWCPENNNVGMQIVHKWLRKTLYALCRSCRGMGDLQPFYLCLGPLLLGIFEKNPAKQCYLILFWCQNALERVSARRRRARATLAPAALSVHARKGSVVPSGPCAVPGSLCMTSVGPWSVPRGTSPCAGWPRRFLPLAAAPPARHRPLPLYPSHVATHTATSLTLTRKKHHHPIAPVYKSLPSLPRASTERRHDHHWYPLGEICWPLIAIVA
jgi:hypothetical protein